MNNDKKVTRQYLKEVKARLNCPKSVKSIFLKDLKEKIATSYSQSHAITRKSLCAEFGSPEEISDSFYNRGDYEELIAKAKKNLFFWKITTSVIAIMLALTIIFLIYVIQASSVEINITELNYSEQQNDIQELS